MKIILNFEKYNFWHIVFSHSSELTPLGLGVSSVEWESETKEKRGRISICQECSSKSLWGSGKARKKEEGSEAHLREAYRKKEAQSSWFFSVLPQGVTPMTEFSPRASVFKK